MARAASYKGDGSEFLNDIPARDLSDEDWALLSDEQKRLVDASPLYRVMKAGQADLPPPEDNEQDAAEPASEGAV